MQESIWLASRFQPFLRYFQTAGLVLILCSSQGVFAGRATGTYHDSGNEFAIGYALADRAEDGTVRILLASQEPELAGRDRHLDRLEALAETAKGGYLMLEPTADGDRFNITISVEGSPFGGGGQYESKIEFSETGASGKIDTEVLSEGRLTVSFETEYLPARQKTGDLPTDGGAPGALLLEQMRASASGDREAILRTLEPEQREQFQQMSAKEQADAISFLVDLTPRNVQITGGVLYDGYAIVEFSGDADGAQASGRALVVQNGDQWQILEVSTKLQ